MSKESETFEQLLEAACNGELDEARQASLEQILLKDPEARAKYVKYIGMDTDLWLGADPARGSSSLPKTTRLSPAWGFGVAAAAAVIWAVTLTWQGAEPAGPAPAAASNAAPVAYLTRSNAVQWKDSSASDRRAFAPGSRLELRAGLVEIAFDRGARAIVEGPAQLEIVSGMRAKLQQGRLVATVPLDAAGFTVDAPTTTVVDLGTEFAMRVSDGGETDIHVFEGEVDVATPNLHHSAAPESTRLLGGEAARVSRSAVDRSVRVDVATFTRSNRLTQLVQRRVAHDAFDGAKLDARQWHVARFAPHADVSVENGKAVLKNRGYLVARERCDPVAAGGLRVTGRFECVSPPDAEGHYRTNIFSVVTRSDATAQKPYHDAAHGIEFIAFSGTRWPKIRPRGDRIELTKPRALRKLDRIRPGVAYDFEIVDDGWNLCFTMTEAGRPENRAEVVARVIRDRTADDRVLFYGRERQGNGTEYRVLLDDVTLSTGVGPCR